jgi:hypothetical protein
MIEQSVAELFERGWLVGDERLSVTDTGREHLSRGMRRTRGDMHRLSADKSWHGQRPFDHAGGRRRADVGANREITTKPEAITIVSGLPRSGTSMMMAMLEAGGMQLLVDNIRTADEDNPRGYYEFERVKRIQHDQSWLGDARGKVVKMISELLKHLPQDYAYKVIFMHRKMEEILASQRRMLIRRGEPTDKVSDERLTELYQKHLRWAEDWIDKQPNIEVIYVSYNEILENPLELARRINQFLGNTLNVENMVGVVDPTLYRQRR